MAWTNEHLDALRVRGDLEAAAAVDSILATGRRAALMDWLTTRAHNGDPLPDWLPADARRLLLTPLPPWAEPALLAAGQRLFLRSTIPMLQTLLVRSLPEVYAAAPIARVLMRSAKLEGDVPRRVAETLQFVIDVAQPHGFGPGGRGLRTALRVRLMHAAVRRMLAHEGLHIAINQEDLAATLVTFSAFLVDGLRRFGATVSDEEEAGWMHLWDVAGAGMGIETRFGTRASAEEWFVLYRRRTHAATEEGRALTRSLLAFADTLLPGDALDGLNPTVFRFLSGDPLADLLAVPPADWTVAFVAPYRAVVAGVDFAEDVDPAARRLAMEFGRRFARGLVESRLPDGRARFELPAELTGPPFS